jgi:hypothetical protein
MQPSFPSGPLAWVDRYCPSIDGQFLFLDPLRWDTHLLSEGAVIILREAARAIEAGGFAEFRAEVDAAGGWPPALERLAFALSALPAGDAAAETGIRARG